MEKVKVNENCFGCGACTSIAPEVFALGDDGYAKAISNEVDDKEIDSVKEAMECCPASAIEVSE